MAAPEYEIICPDCGGAGCLECDGIGTVVIAGTNPRADGLPWHPHAVEGPKDIHVPVNAQGIRRRRAGHAPTMEELEARAADLAARERELVERERAVADTQVITPPRLREPE